MVELWFAEELGGSVRPLFFLSFGEGCWALNLQRPRLQDLLLQSKKQLDLSVRFYHVLVVMLSLSLAVNLFCDDYFIGP